MKKSIKLRLIFLYNITLLISAVALYYLIPILLNYAPGSINTEFDRQMSGGFTYLEQIILLTGCLSVLITLTLLFILRKLDNYSFYKSEYLKTHDKKYAVELTKIKKICFSLPSYILIIFITVPIVLEILFLLAQTYTSNTDFKLILIIFIVSTIAVSIDNMYAKKLMSGVLTDLENLELPAKKGKLLVKVLVQIIPIIFVGVVFTFLSVSSIYEQQNGRLLSEYYSLQFKYLSKIKQPTSYDQLENLMEMVDLSDDTDTLYIADSNFNFVYSSGELTNFFKTYAQEFSLNSDLIVYDYYGTSGQGIIFPLEINGETWYLGAHYSVYSSSMLISTFQYMILISIICILVLTYFCKELCGSISTVENALQVICDNKTLDKNLFVTSNDEIGSLAITINRLQELNQQQLKQIQNNQEILMEKERLASLGQLIGGISHNLKTPIMSISGATEGILDLIEEYESSVGDPEVTVEDHHAIAKDMRDWIDKIHSYTAYMSDIITAVKGQAVVLSENENAEFTVDELLKRVDILMKHEVRNASLTIETKLDVPESTILHGDINSLVQVINNLITNAIQSYNGRKNDSILLEVKTVGETLVISVTDHGCGMPKAVQDKLFKSMVTTKGKNGTGLGMFMSYSTIKGHFNGDITFESEIGKGSTFNVILPLRK